jgi:hypothetical protein
MAGVEHVGYAPAIAGICDDDDLFPTICLDCGQVQGVFPVKAEFFEDYTSFN